VVSFRCHAISTNCIRISKPQFAARTRFCRVWRSAVKLNEVLSVGGLIARRYLDGPEVLSLRFLNFTAESTSKLRRLRNSRLLPRVQTKKSEDRFGWCGYEGEDIRRAQTRGGGWECVAEQQPQNENLRARPAPGVQGTGSHSLCLTPYYSQPRSQRTESQSGPYTLHSIPSTQLPDFARLIFKVWLGLMPWGPGIQYRNQFLSSRRDSDVPDKTICLAGIFCP
jgi:hypothetical protein